MNGLVGPPALRALVTQAEELIDEVRAVLDLLVAAAGARVGTGPEPLADIPRQRAARCGHCGEQPMPGGETVHVPGCRHDAFTTSYHLEARAVWLSDPDTVQRGGRA